MKHHRETFNDGVLIYGNMLRVRSKTGKLIGEIFQPKGKLAFRLMSAREQDYQLSGTMGNSLDLKVKTLLPPMATFLFSKSYENLRKSNIKVRIETTEYDVITVDFDKSRRYLFFYLQEVGGFNDE